MTLTQILQKIKSAFYTKSETDTLLGGKSDTTHNHNSAYLGISAKAESSKSADSVAWANVSGKPSTYTPSSHTHSYAGSPSAGGAASSTLKIETYKQGSTTETYGASYPIFAQWIDNTNVALKCTNYTVWVDKANSVAWDNVSGRPTKVSQFTNDSGFITGITKAMVTNALGYTPPTSDTNTTYSAGTNMSLSGTTFATSSTPSFSNVTVTNNSSNGLLFGSYRVYVG